MPATPKQAQFLKIKQVALDAKTGNLIAGMWR
jgi:hypothetical protein